MNIRITHKHILIIVGTLIIGTCCSGKDSFYAHDEAEESRLIQFVTNHPEIDFTTYISYPYAGVEKTADNFPFVAYAVACNYPNLLTTLETHNTAISRYTLGELEPSLLELAMTMDSHDVIDLLIQKRPEWINDFSKSGMSPLDSAIIRGNVTLAKKLLEANPNQSQQRGGAGLPWMDYGVEGGIDMYVLLRNRGARFGFTGPLPTALRQQLAARYSGEMLHLYTNALALPSGTRIDFAMAPDRALASEDTVAEVTDALKTVSARCHGTVLVVFHTSNAEPAGLRMEMIAEDENIAIVRIPTGAESDFDSWPAEYLPRWHAPSENTRIQMEERPQQGVAGYPPQGVGSPER
jgi:hypothetical protein